MDFRVFAYGGTSFRDRLRIGDWSNLPTPVFEDYYGLRGGLPWFGFCVVGHRPFLLWRELQNVASRGGYPFTLLLDPGSEVYEAVEWNTAALLAALFEGENATGRRLLEQPEGIGSSELQAIFSRALDRRAPADAAAPPAADIWAACALASDVVAIPPSALSLKGRPDASAIARIQSQLPAGLRNSGGWLVGASVAHSRQLGARLAVDDRAELTQQALDAILADGRELLESAKKIRSMPSWQKSLLDNLREGPAWLSPDGVKLTMQAVRALEEPVRKPERLIDFVTELAAGAAKDQWCRAACEIIVQRSGTFPRRHTQFLLGEAYRGVYSLRTDDFRRLEPAAVKAFLDEKEIPPRPVPPTLGVPEDVLLTRLTTRIAAAGDSAPAVLRESLEMFPDGLNSAAELDLIEAAWNASAAKGGELAAWRSLLGRPEVKNRVIAEARRRALYGERFSSEEYDEFAADPDWTYLEKALRADTMPRVAAALFARGDIRRLRTIARWPQRIALPIGERRAIAALAGGDWEHFTLLERLVRGDPALEITAPPDAERAILAAEAIELVAGLDGDPSRPPNLVGLRRLLGALPPDVVRRLSLMKPPLEEELAARQWIDGWKDVDNRKHDTELGSFIRLRLQAGAPVPASSSYFADAENLAEFLRQLLWKDHVLADANASEMLERLFEQWREEPGFRETLNQVFLAAAANPKKKILKRVGARPGAAALFRELLSEDPRRNLGEIELEGLLLGEEWAEIPSSGEFREGLVRAGRERLNRTLAAWLAETGGDRARQVAYRFAASKAHLAALLDNLDEAQQTRLMEVILDANVPIDPQFPLDKAENAVKIANDLGVVGRVLARVRLTSRPNWSPPAPHGRGLLSRLRR